MICGLADFYFGLLLFGEYCWVLYWLFGLLFSFRICCGLIMVGFYGCLSCIGFVC